MRRYARAQNEQQKDQNKMKPHQERVVTEKTELDDKRQKLRVFIGGDVYRTLDTVEQSRLNRQLEAMTLYSNILAERIDAFEVGSVCFVLLPRSELTNLLCKCGAPMGEDGHADVYDLDGKTAVAEVRCAKCEEALGKSK